MVSSSKLIVKGCFMGFNLPKVKKAEPRQYTEEQIRELKRCSSDLSYFAKYLKLTKKGDPIRWRDYQLREFDICQKYNNIIHNWCRQSGNRWIEAAYILWYVTFHSARCCVLCDIKHSLAKEQLALIKTLYTNLPWWLKKDADFHKIYATFGTGLDKCTILVEAYGAGGFRGRTVNLFVCRNFAFLKESIANDFAASVFPVHMAGHPDYHRMLISSCPNGKGNLFHHLWENCIQLPNVIQPERTAFVGTEVTYSKNVKPYVKKDMASLLPRNIYLSEYECKFVDR